MILIFGVSSKHYDRIRIPERDFQYIVHSLQIKYRLNSDDAKNCVLELEHFYTGIKYNILNSELDRPPTAILNAWETHIVYTSMYFNFTHSIFGKYIHYKPIEQDKGQLYVYDLLKQASINTMNETVWLLEPRWSQKSENARWNKFFIQSNNLPDFNRMTNKFLKKFIEEYTSVSHGFQVLDIGMGQGRNSIWLAQRGYNVTGFDASIEGIKIVKNQAKQLNLITLKAYVTTAEEFNFGLEQWDLILCMYFPIINSTSYLRKIEQSLKCNGYLIAEAFHWDGLYDGHDLPLGVTYKTNDIPSLFPNLTTIIYEEPVGYSDFGKLRTKLIQYVGQKQHC
jgi:SAM-dependent methyltransferase